MGRFAASFDIADSSSAPCQTGGRTVLRRLAWSSVASASFSVAGLDDIVACAGRNNERHHVSGRMLFTGVHFLGILEGAEWDLARLWAKLDQDDRHRDLRRMADVLCGDRWFPTWMMSRNANAVVRARIDSLLSTQVRSPVAEWAEAIHPIMLHAVGV